MEKRPLPIIEKSLDELYAKWNTNPEIGLTNERVAALQSRYGKNIFNRGRHTTIFDRILRQLKSPLVIILLVACGVTILLQKYIDTFVIVFALLINIIVGTLQEERAGKAFDALTQFQQKRAVVIRNGSRSNIDASELVPGDIIVLLSGYQVPADVRIIFEKDLRINESMITGEWHAVEKDSVEQTPIESTSTGQNRTTAFMGTLVESGYGTGLVVATGNSTFMGSIAHSLQQIDESVTPLQANMQTIARFLTITTIVAVSIIFVLGLLRNEPFIDILLLSVAVAVATVPSGLPAAVTVVLALGMEAILKRGGLVRNLLAAETLGATTVVLTDKTGTLTEARMHLTSLHTASSQLAIASQPQSTSRIHTEDDTFLLTAAVLSSDAFIEENVQSDGNLEIVVHGRPIEKAMVLAGLEEGISQSELLANGYIRHAYLQFESYRRFGASLVEQTANGINRKEKRRLFLTGAPETLLNAATHIEMNGKRQKITAAQRAMFNQLILEKSALGMRLIAASYKDGSWSDLQETTQNDPREDLREKTTFIGIITFADPVRTEVPKAILAVKRAGVSVIMVTGDNPETARAIAYQAGITVHPEDPYVLGEQIEDLSKQAICALLAKVSVVARALPSHKMQIVNALKAQGEVVAMTGDGVNDAPALQSASIGVAVESGTEVAKQASDIILIGNSFSIIVSAIEEGRRIVDNLKKILAYLLAGSFSEIFVISGALVMGAPLPFLPTQILWTKIIEEGLMSFSFAFEKKDPGAMTRDPREMATKQILTPQIRNLIFIVTFITGGFLIALYFTLLQFNIPIEKIRTIMFAALSMDAIFFSVSLKNFRLPLWKINPFDNHFLLIALVCSIMALALALGTPLLRTMLSLVPLSFGEFLLLLCVGLFNVATIEIVKYILFRRRAL